MEDPAALFRILPDVPDAVGPAAPVTEAEIDCAHELARAMTLNLGAGRDPDLPHLSALRRPVYAVLLSDQSLRATVAVLDLWGQRR